MSYKSHYRRPSATCPGCGATFYVSLPDSVIRRDSIFKSFAREILTDLALNSSDQDMRIDAFSLLELDKQAEGDVREWLLKFKKNLRS